MLKKELFHCEDGQTQEKAIQRDCRVSILGARVTGPEKVTVDGREAFQDLP